MAKERELGVEVDRREFERWVRRYALAVDKGMTEVLEEQMGRVLTAAAMFTPPFPTSEKGQVRAWQRTPKGRMTVRWAQHREAGKNALLKDLLGRAGRKDGIFETRPREWFEWAIQGLEVLRGAGDPEILRADRARMVATVRKSLPLGWEESAARAQYKEFLEPDYNASTFEGHHRRQRSSATGRTYRKSRQETIVGRAGVTDVMVTTPEAFERYLASREKRLGVLKKGWYTASLLLGVRMPNFGAGWVKKAPARGEAAAQKRLQGRAKYMLARNLVRYSGRQNAQVGITRMALRYAGRNLQKQVEAKERGAWRKSARRRRG